MDVSFIVCVIAIILLNFLLLPTHFECWHHQWVIGLIQAFHAVYVVGEYRPYTMIFNTAGLNPPRVHTHARRQLFGAQ